MRQIAYDMFVPVCSECPVLFSRLAATKRLDTLLKAQERLDDW